MSAPIMATLARDAALSNRYRWRVELREVKTGKVLPVMIEAGPEYRAISAAMNKASRFFPGLTFRPVSARRVLPC